MNLIHLVAGRYNRNNAPSCSILVQCIVISSHHDWQYRTLKTLLTISMFRSFVQRYLLNSFWYLTPLTLMINETPVASTTVSCNVVPYYSRYGTFGGIFINNRILSHWTYKNYTVKLLFFTLFSSYNFKWWNYYIGIIKQF